MNIFFVNVTSKLEFRFRLKFNSDIIIHLVMEIIDLKHLFFGLL